jgi:hypothetical protein
VEDQCGERPRLALDLVAWDVEAPTHALYKQSPRKLVAEAAEQRCSVCLLHPSVHVGERNQTNGRIYKVSTRTHGPKGVRHRVGYWHGVPV